MSTIGKSATKRYLGKHTADLAINLDKLIKELNLGSSHRVICSHVAHYGDEAKEVIKSAGIEFRNVSYFSGEGQHGHTHFGTADIAIVRQHPWRVVLLIEIEENPAGVQPKLLAADAVLPMLAERLAVRQNDNSPNGVKKSHEVFDLSGAQLWVGHHPRPSRDTSRSEALENSLNELLGAWADWKERRGGPEPIDSIRIFNHPPERLYDVMLAEARRLLTPVAVPRAAPSELEPARPFGEHLVADPGICHGQWTFRGTRVPVRVILDRIDAGASDGSIQRDWPQLSPEALREARDSGRRLLSLLEPAGSGAGA